MNEEYSNTTDQQTADNKASSEIVETHQVENTLFVVRKLDDKWFVTLGQYKMSPIVNSKEEALAFLQPITWDMIMKVMNVMATLTINDVVNNFNKTKHE